MPSALSVWHLFQLSKVDWSVLPSLIPTWLGMYVVVAFSSSLDVAAIQMDMGKQLDFNHELMTVGISNFVSGLTGGFTGSYIFSQALCPPAPAPCVCRVPQVAQPSLARRPSSPFARAPPRGCAGMLCSYASFCSSCSPSRLLLSSRSSSLARCVFS